MWQILSNSLVQNKPSLSGALCWQTGYPRP